MKKVIVAILALCGAAFAGTCGNSYTSSYKITLNKPSSTLTNFPFLIGFNDSTAPNQALNGLLGDLRTVANGGKVQNTAANSLSVTGPADVVFCDAASAGNPIKYETAAYSATTGRAEFWVLIASLSSSSNTQIWMFVGNAAVVTTQQDLSLWTDAGFALVCHEADGSSLNIKCSKSIGTEVNNGSVPAVTAKIGGGASFASASSQFISTGGTNNTATQTVELWYKIPSTIANCNSALISEFSVAPDNGWQINQVSSGFGCSTTTSSNFINYQNASGGNYMSNAFGNNIIPNTWTSIAATQTGTTVNEYINGVLVGPSNVSGSQPIGSNSGTLFIGENLNGGASRFDGSLDEIRISNSVRSTAWLAETYSVESGASSAFKIEPVTSITYPMIIQFAQNCFVSNNTTLTCPFPFSITSGSKIVVAGEYANSISCPVISDTLTTTYSTLNSNINLGGATQKTVCLFAGTASSSGANTVTSFGSGAFTLFHNLQIYEVAAPSLTVVNSSAQAATPSSNPITLPSVTVATANSLQFCNVSDIAGGGFSATAPSNLLSGTKTSTYSFSWSYGLAPSGSQNCTFTLASPTSDAAILTVIAPAATTRKIKASVMY